MLPGGRTGHSRFKIPMNVNERSQCSISRSSMLAGLCQRASLILWDEAPMTSRLCFEALDRTLRDILSVHNEANGLLPFVGKVMVLGGDFRQILPVVEGGTKEDIIDASLVTSPLWHYVKILKLHTNMRLCNPELTCEAQSELAMFSSWVQSIGDGSVEMQCKKVMSPLLRGFLFPRICYYFQQLITWKLRLIMYMMCSF